MPRLILLLTIYLVANLVSAQSGSNAGHSEGAGQLVMRWRHLTVKDGLPSNVIRCGLQDREGFIWLGTREGLVRYDGKKFTVHTREKHGLSSNTILAIEQLEDDWLWVLCGKRPFMDNGGGYIDLVNTRTGEVLKFHKQVPLAEDVLFRLFRKLYDTTLVLSSTRGDFYTYSGKEGLRKFDVHTSAPWDFRVSPGGRIWIGHLKDTDIKEAITTVKLPDVRQIDFLKSSELANLSVVGFDADSCPVGIVQNEALGPLKVVKLTAEGSIKDMATIWEYQGDLIKVKGIGFSPYPDDPKPLWLQSTRKGLFRASLDGQLEMLLDSMQHAQIFRQEDVFSLFGDKSGKYWMPTSEGLFVFSIAEDKFKKVLNSQTVANMRPVRGLSIDVQGNLLMAAESEGMFLMRKDRSVQKLSSNHAHVTYSDSTGRFFAYGKMEEVDLQTYKTIKHKVPELLTLWSIFRDGKGSWWFGGGDGILKCKDLHGPCEDLTRKIFKEGSREPTYQIFREGNKMWFITAAGLFWYDEKSKTSGKVEPTGQGGDRLMLSDIHHVHRDGDVWWIATNGKGLVRWNRSDNSFHQWIRTDGLSSNILYASLEDDHGQLWISSDYGLMQFGKSSGKIKAYTTEDGLPHHEFNRVSWCQDDEGTMYFGSLNGVVYFNPGDFTAPEKDYKAPLKITRFLQYDEEEQDLEDRTYQLQTHNRILLGPRSSFFSLHFNLLDFEEDEKRYVYKISGLGQGWEELTSGEIQLGNLPYGAYHLLVNGQNQAGQWSSSTLNIPLVVEAPFYVQWWFVLIVVVSMILIVLGIIRWRTWYLEREKIHLHRQVDLQTHRLQQSLEEKEVLLKEVHHRVKNNLQIISSLLNLEASGEDDPRAQKLLTEARHRIKSMALIHKNLYQFNDLSHIIMSNYLQELLQGLDQSYNKSQEEVSYSIKNTDVVLDVGIALPLGLIISELVSNSYKYAFRGVLKGKIEIGLTESSDQLILQVSDNGIGLSEELHELNSESLGLRLVRLLTKQLKGNVRVLNESGTTFTFTIPNYKHGHRSKISGRT